MYWDEVRFARGSDDNHFYVCVWQAGKQGVSQASFIRTPGIHYSYDFCFYCINLKRVHTRGKISSQTHTAADGLYCPFSCITLKMQSTY